VSTGSYLAAVAGIVGTTIAAAATGVALRRRWFAAWSGAAARLAEAVIAIEVVVVVAEGLGTVGLLRRAVLLPVIALVAVGSWRWGRTASRGPGPPAPPAPPHARWASGSAAVLASVVVVQWTARTVEVLRTGFVDTDSLQYHLPMAARFAQTGWVSRLHFLWIDPVWTFYPANGELLHAVGMVATGRDVAVPLLNLAWLLLALLAGWVLGRPFALGHLTVAGVALLAASPLLALIEPGGALTDIAALALVLSAAAVLAQGDRGPAPLVLAGVAAGLAVGTKLTAVGPVLALTVAVIVLAGRGERAGTARSWLGGVAMGGGYWFARNLARTGNPLPWYGIAGLPSPRFPVLDAYGHSILDYLTDGSFWRDVVPPGLETTFGPAYVLVVIVVIVALAHGATGLGPAPGGRDHPADLGRALLLAAVVGVAVYAANPVAAFGPPGDPWQFGINLRYAFPSLACALVVGALSLDRRTARVQAVAVAVVGAGVGAELLSRVGDRRSLAPGWVVVAVGLGVAAAVAWPRRGNDPRLRRGALVLGVALVLLVAVLGRGVADSYLARRSARDPLVAWAQTTSGAQVAVVGLSEQYRAQGFELTNRVQYLGEVGSHGAFGTITSCARFRELLREGGFDHLVAGSDKWSVQPTPEIGWESADPAATAVLDFGAGTPGGRIVVFQLDPTAPTATSSCP
jgi:hypothetical protein